MIRSMTGFGKSEATISGKKIAVEIRTLNSKQLDMSLRMPSAYRVTEFDVRGVITRGVQRGKCDVTVTIASEQIENATQINEAVFVAYCEQIRAALAAAGVKGEITPSDALAALRLPEVIATKTEGITDAECAAIVSLTEAAVKHLNSFREQEGAILIADLLRRVDLIEEYMVAIEPFEQPRVEAIRERIREHIAKERIDVDNNRLEAEMIFYVEKLDITEEKVRLRNHCKYFREVSAEEQGVGRKLGFIAQEMGREINTMGSKSNDAQMQRLVVQMKDELEKIKEQVLNIL
ncbi:MAG: YicC/YloC family endoribonuclease [Rikenellaceae bacterium]